MTCPNLHKTKADKLKLVSQSWYAWQMIPGYIGERNVPYCSPIWVEQVVPKKTGKGILTLDFVNVSYAEGVQDFSVGLKILKHSANYLIAELLHGPDESERVAIVSHIEFAWIERLCPDWTCPELWRSRPPSSIGGTAVMNVSVYLDRVFCRRLRKSHI